VTCVTNLPQCQGDVTPNAEVTVHKTGGIAHGNADVPSGDEIEVKGDVTLTAGDCCICVYMWMYGHGCIFVQIWMCVCVSMCVYI